MDKNFIKCLQSRKRRFEKDMKMLGFKFEQNRTISEEFYFLRGEGGGATGPHL